MPELDVMDSTWIGVRPAAVAPVVADSANWRRWWPDLELQVEQRRGLKGMRWIVLSGRDAAVSGSMEVWLEPVHDGTVAHYFLRLDGTRHRLRPSERRRLEHDYRTRIKRAFWAVSDRLDPGRMARVGGPNNLVP